MPRLLLAPRQPWPSSLGRGHGRLPLRQQLGRLASPGAVKSGGALFKNVSVVALEAWHLDVLRTDPQREQRSEAQMQLEMPTGPAWAAMVGGVPVAAAGVCELWPGRGYAWALFAQKWPIRPVLREIRSRLSTIRFARLEMVVDAQFEQAARFAEHLGFRREWTAQRYLPNGHDAHIYVRFSEWHS